MTGIDSHIVVSDQSIPRDGRGGGCVDPAEVDQAIAKHIAEIRSPTDVATLLSVPYNTLRLHYRRCSGRTLGHAIRRVRIRRMKELLEETDMLCFEVCYAVGLRREETGARLFKSYTGLTMSEYRDS